VRGGEAMSYLQIALLCVSGLLLAAVYTVWLVRENKKWALKCREAKLHRPISTPDVVIVRMYEPCQRRSSGGYAGWPDGDYY